MLTDTIEHFYNHSNNPQKILTKQHKKVPSDPSCIHQGARTSTQDGVAHLPVLWGDQRVAHGLCWESKEARRWEK